jgi:glycosyltransferase involved in cell wall biosynthesis
MHEQRIDELSRALERFRRREEVHVLEKQLLREKCDRAALRRPKDNTPRKPAVLLFPDQDFWAFHNIAKNVQRYLSDDFTVIIRPYGINSELVYDDPAQIFLVAEHQADIIHFFWRNDLLSISSKQCPYPQQIGMTYIEFLQRFLSPKIISCGIYDHLYLEEEECEKRALLFSDIIDAYYTSNKKLYRIYEQIPQFPAPFAQCEDGVDTSLFLPQNMERFASTPPRPLVIGWSGNSTWMSGSTEDAKGFQTIILPALEILRRENVAVTFSPADRKERLIPHLEMPDYYASIDVLVCASKIEGTPNPVLEAMACGVPVVSTDVGIVPDVFGPKQQTYILPERTPEALARALKELALQPGILQQLSGENQQRIQQWDWSVKTENFRKYFWRLLSMKHPERLWLGADGETVRATPEGPSPCGKAGKRGR